MPFYRYIPDTADLNETEDLPTVLPVNYHDEQVSWAYLQENGYFFLLDGDLRFMMERQQLTPHLVTDPDDNVYRIVALDLVTAE